MSDPFGLQRFVDAQAPVYPRVVAELRHGQKQSHWMWFIFPQLAGLGFSPMAQRFALRSRDEAVAYLGHGVLGPRLRESRPRCVTRHTLTSVRESCLNEVGRLTSAIADDRSTT